jgi:hypothetical protein
MKQTRSLDKASNPEEQMPGSNPSAQEDSRHPVESDLSQERINTGASSNLEMLNQMLAQKAALHQLRDWGINE